MQRILEPEVMDTPEEAREYDAMDFTEVNNAFAQHLLSLTPSTHLKVLDAGTGTARIPIIIAQARSQWKITGIDLAESMLELGRKNVIAAGLAEKIRLETVDAKQMPYDDNSFDVVISNSLVHHLPNPLSFLSEVKRVILPGGAVLIRDLLRPKTVEEMNAMVKEVGAEYDEHQTKLFRDSLHAALSLNEVQELIERAGLKGVKVYQSSDRHWTAERTMNNE